MANDYLTDNIILDTFSAAIDLRTLRAATTGYYLYGFPIGSIEWVSPTTVGHTCVITDGESGRSIFSEKCVIANDSIIKHFNGKRFTNLYIAIDGVGSGKVAIQLRK